MAALPYDPTRFLKTPSTKDALYVLEPTSSQLLALHTNQTLNNTVLPYSTISPSLPFLESTPNISYTAAIDDNGNILVFTGQCGGTGEGSALWRFSPDGHDASMNGTWKKLDLLQGEVGNHDGANGANYLSSAIAFSGTANSSSEVFIFGGMCPNSNSSDPKTWQQAAQYSNSMLVIKSPDESSNPAPRYERGISTGRGPPIAEAGFSITPLQPTFFESTASNQSQSRNQNFVLLGGHTQQAFINMSQVALFSLPEQSWAFLPVDSPSQESKTDLASRDRNSVDSRSGHTAVLTSDGKRVVVFGGWVGDVTTPAEPQLVVLEIGEDYGGSGDWQWSIPSQTGSGLMGESGIYGHGAVMLAGDVMMVVGGYSISGPSSARRKRASISTSTSTYFFNTTSNAWLSSYAHPKSSASYGNLDGVVNDNKAADRRIGLGVGLTFGVLALIAILVFYLWYKRRLKRQRDDRANELRYGQHDNHPRADEMSMLGNKLLVTDGPYPSSRSGPEAERTGLLFEIPSPTRGLRRSLHSRSTYQPTSRFDDGRWGPLFSTIHPIDERAEYDEKPADEDSPKQHETLQQDDYNVLNNVPVLDPFKDSPNTSRTPSPQSPQDRELEIRNWVNDWTAADARMHSQVGCISPEKTERTSSTLSDQSARSASSYHSIQQSVGSISRSMSQRSATLLSGTPFRTNIDAMPTNVQQGAVQRANSGHRRAQSLTINSPMGTGNSYATAATSFSQLQSEGEALLGHGPVLGETSPRRSQSRARGWMGSVRRALTGTERSPSTLAGNNDSTASSPTKHSHTDQGLPRRAASTGGMLWQRKQGAKDWDVDRDKQDIAGSTEKCDEGNEEWDVESAVERRVVQVMFTVPKERLRVINRGPDGDGESILSAEVKEAVDEDDTHDKGKGKERE